MTQAEIVALLKQYKGRKLTAKQICAELLKKEGSNISNLLLKLRHYKLVNYERIKRKMGMQNREIHLYWYKE